MLKATSVFPTEKAERYLKQLCKHFAHKIEVVEGDGVAGLGLPTGPASMWIGDGGLHLEVQAKTAEDLEKGKEILESHLLRFAFRDEPDPLDWSGPDEAA